VEGFVKIGAVDELPSPGEAREFPFGSKLLCVANVEGKIAAVDNFCSHRGGPLGQGIVEGSRIVCPWHGWEFELTDGTSPMGESISVDAYEVKIEGNEVFARLKQSS
jgi:nitrite reductase (NADH) small subunit